MDSQTDYVQAHMNTNRRGTAGVSADEIQVYGQAAERGRAHAWRALNCARRPERRRRGVWVAVSARRRPARGSPGRIPGTGAYAARQRRTAGKFPDWRRAGGAVRNAVARLERLGQNAMTAPSKSLESLYFDLIFLVNMPA